jgi:kynurenine formamidase
MLQAREEDLRAADFLLLNTGWDGKWGSKGYFSGFPVLTPEAAEFLAESGLKGLGVDAVSVDPAGAEDLFVHRTLLGAGMLIVENLRGLGELPAFGFTFVCAPLPLSGADGAPVRALALV